MNAIEGALCRLLPRCFIILAVQRLAATWTLRPNPFSAGLRKPRQELLSYYAAFGRSSEKDGASLTSAEGTYTKSC